jgi:hypothetical protein
MVRVNWRSGPRGMLRVGELGGGGLGFAGSKGIAWVFRRGLGTRGRLLRFAEPLRGVDFCLDGRGLGLRFGWGGAAVGNQSFDGYDYGKGLDLTGDASSG